MVIGQLQFNSIQWAEAMPVNASIQMTMIYSIRFQSNSIRFDFNLIQFNLQCSELSNSMRSAQSIKGHHATFMQASGGSVPRQAQYDSMGSCMVGDEWPYTGQP